MRWLPFLLTVSLVTGCASLSLEQCRQGDWRQIGFADGIEGVSAVRINDHAKACAEHGVRPNLDEYLHGREQGLLSYCQAENGFTIGRRGNEHNVVDCPENMKWAFLDRLVEGTFLKFPGQFYKFNQKSAPPAL